MSDAEPLVVIAEDDENIRRLLEVVVKNAGCKVASAPDGEIALKMIQTLRPRLAILDVSMPLRSGIEVGKALQADASAPKTPIIFLTSHTQEQDVLEGFLAGAVDYLFKPFSPRELRARLQSIIARQWPRP